MRIICRLDFWGREIKGKFFRDPQAPQNPYRLIVAQCCTKQIGKFWGCCPQAGARVLEITETHFQEQQAGDVWDLYLMNSMPTPENQVFHNFMLLPKSQQYIDTTRKMSEERWQFLGSINASMARMDLENLLKSFLEPNENLEFHSSHAHMLIMMDKATDRPEVRKIKENRQMQKLKKHTTSRGSATDRSSTGASTASSSSVQVDGTESIGASTSTTVAAASVHRPKPETSQTSTKRVAPSPTTLTTVGSLDDSSESPSIATQVSAFSSFQPPSHNYGQSQSQSHQRSVNFSGANRRPASKQQQPRAYHLQDPLEMMTGVMADMNLKSQPTTTILPLPSHHHSHPPPSYNYHPYYAAAPTIAAPLSMAHADPYGYAPPHVGHYHHNLSSASSSYSHHQYPTSASTTSMLLNHHHQQHQHQHQHAYAMDPWTASAQQQQQQVDAATFYQQHHSLTTTATTAMIHPTIPLAPHHNSGLYEYYPPPPTSTSPTPPCSFSLSVVDHHSNANYSPASTPTTIVPKTPSPEASANTDSTESTASTTPPGQSSSSAAEEADEAEEEQREEQSSGEQLTSVV